MLIKAHIEESHFNECVYSTDDGCKWVVRVEYTYTT